MGATSRAIDPSLPIPAFVQLKDLLVRGIVDGSFGADGRLPTEYEICQAYGISRTPVHRALAELAEEGAVIRTRRKGTFVNQDWLAARAEKRVVSVVVPEGEWADLITGFAPRDIVLETRQVSLSGLHDHLVHAVASGDAPDLALLDSVWVPEFAQNGFLRPLDDLDPAWVGGALADEFAPTFVDAHRVGGLTVAVQFEADVAGMWFERSAVKNAGFEPPRTWGELRSAARAGRASDGEAIALPAGRVAGEASSYVLMSLLASNGASVLDERGVTLQGDRAVEALEFLRALASDGLIDVSRVGESRERPIHALAEGRVVFAFGGSYELPALARASGLDQGAAWERYGFVPFPAGPAGRSMSLAGGMALGVFRQSSRPKLAMTLLRSLVDTEAQRTLARTTGQIPARSTAIEGIAEPGSLLAASSQQLDGAVMRPLVDSYERVSQQLQAMMAEIVAGDGRPRQAAERTAQMVSAITGLPLVTA